MSNTIGRPPETGRLVEYPPTERRGLARPGAKQMLIGAVGLIVESLGPALYAAFNRPHEVEVFFTGVAAFAVFALTAAFAILYIVGFLRYTRSKGYTMWLGVLLLFCNAPGLIVLLMLPERSATRV